MWLTTGFCRGVTMPWLGFWKAEMRLCTFRKSLRWTPGAVCKARGGEVRRGAGYSVLAHRPCPQKCTHLPGKEPAMDVNPPVCLFQGVNEPHCSLLSPGHPSLTTLSSSQQHGNRKVKRDNFLITTRETHTNYPHSPATLIRQT